MKNLIYTLLLLTAFITQSCKPEETDYDPAPPNFVFKIIGDGEELVFTQDDDYENLFLHLRNATKYNFSFEGKDPDGLELMRLIFMTLII